MAGMTTRISNVGARGTRKWRELPRVGVIKNYDKYHLDRLSRTASISGESVLCVGYSESEIDEYIVKHKPKDITIITNWTDHIDASASRFPVVHGDITKRTSFRDGQFGAVLTMSVMEHLSDLAAGLTEINRILEPDGYLFVNFGAAWSCAYGHHLYLRGGEPLLDFSQWQLPAYLHLLCQEDEIGRFVVENGLAPEYIPWFLGAFYESPIINRLMYEDFMRLFSEHFQLVQSEVMYNDVPPEFVAELRQKYEPYRDFTSYGGKYLLKKLPL